MMASLGGVAEAPATPRDDDAPAARDVFALRLVTIDYYLREPVPGLDVTRAAFANDAPVYKVPVVRVFGETPGGQKACAHVHGAFPYFYVPYDDAFPTDPGECGAFLQRLARALDSAIDASSSSTSFAAAAAANDDATAGATTTPAPPARVALPHSRINVPPRRRRHVHDAAVVRARPLYGYHVSERLFVKLRMYDPSVVTRAANAMLSGMVLNRVFQPHESHVPYVLQVMVDLNLHGMGCLRARRATFRSPERLPRWWDGGLHRRRAPRRFAFSSGGDGPGGNENDAAGRAPPVELEYEDVPPPPPSVDDAAAPPPPERPPVWTRATVPSSWKKVPPPRPRASGDASTVDISTPPDLSLSLSDATHGWTDPPPRTSDVELECDVSIEDVLNVEDVVRRPLHAADDTVRLVQSLVPVWEEETRRAIAEGSTPPARAPPPPRRETIAPDGEAMKLTRRVEDAAAAEKALGIRGALTLEDILREERGDAWGVDANANAIDDGGGDGAARRRAASRLSQGSSQSRRSEDAPASAPAPTPRGRLFASCSPANDVAAPRSSQSQGGGIDAISQPSGALRERQRARLESSIGETARGGETPAGPETQERLERELIAMEDFAAAAGGGVSSPRDFGAVDLSLPFTPASAPIVEKLVSNTLGEEEDERGDPAASSEKKKKQTRDGDGDDDDDFEAMGKLRQSLAAIASAALSQGVVVDEDDDEDDADALQREYEDIVACTAPAPATESELEPSERDEPPPPLVVVVEKSPRSGSRGPCFVCGRDCAKSEPRKYSTALRPDGAEEGYAHTRCYDALKSSGGGGGGANATTPKRALLPSSDTPVQETPGIDSGVASVARSKRRRRTPETDPSTGGPRVCVLCDEEMYEKGVHSPSRGYAHKKCAVAAGWSIPPGQSGDRRRAASSSRLGVESETQPPPPLTTTTTGDDAAPPPGGTYRVRRRAPPPTTAELMSTLAVHGIPSRVPTRPFYGRRADVPPRPFVKSGRAHVILSDDPRDLPAFGDDAFERWRGVIVDEDDDADDDDALGRRRRLWALRPLRPPPSRAALSAWLASRTPRERRPPPGVVLSAATPTPTSGRRETGARPPPPPSPFQPPAGLSIRASSSAIPPGGGSMMSHRDAAGESAPGPDARLDAWLDSLADVDDDGGGRAEAGGASRTHGPAMVGLGATGSHGDEDEEDDDRGPKRAPPPPPPRAPPSPKYDEPASYLETLRFYECEAHADDDGDGGGGETGLEAPAAALPPSVAATATARRRSARPRRGVSQFTPPSGDANEYTPASDDVDFRRSPRSDGAVDVNPEAAATLGVMCVEIVATTRGDKLPDPAHDAVRVIACSFSEDAGATRDDVAFALRPPPPPGAGAGAGADADADAAVARVDALARLDAIPNGVRVHHFHDERALLRGFIAHVLARDPDVLCGFEIQGASVGYLRDRAAKLGIGLLRDVSRAASLPGAAERQDDEYGRLHASGLHVTGRIVINLWRVLRTELKLQSYTMEACARAVLRRRLPRFTHRTLSRWACANDDDFNGFNGGGGVRGGSNGTTVIAAAAHQRWRAIDHASSRAVVVARMLEQLDLVARTSEQARIFGIDFFSVLSRGSQYRVESMLLRLAHTQNYLAVSPSKEQVARQPAMECLPLVMEPESKMYSDPVAVLDFQSLYPSMVIAYNLCFSTCLGRAPRESPPERHLVDAAKLGVLDAFALAPGVLPSLVELGARGGGGGGGGGGVYCAPNGAVFATPSARPGVLPRLLTEILDTRVMVKAALKRAPASAKARKRALNARQIGLKLIANVTYGYAAAGFSGRMPMAELADAIVQCGRDTLERAIRMVHANPAWNCRVVYGDTDSLFVHMPGRSVREAHAIGAEIAAAVTAANPPPVVLKLEKVYSPCILATKKRYVGHAYESADQLVPSFDAKGIETQRRDSCAAVTKLMKASLRLLFTTADLSLVKRHVQRQLMKVMAGRLPLSEFTFAKEVRLGTYSGVASTLPPAAVVAGVAIQNDPRAEPKFGERVPYVVVAGQPGARLVDLVMSPETFIESVHRGHRVQFRYYVEKQIVPAMKRLFDLVGADVGAWYRELPPPPREPPTKRLLANPHAATSSKQTVDAYYLSSHCAVCGEMTTGTRVVCAACEDEPATTTATLRARAAEAETRAEHLAATCRTCGGCGGGVGVGSSAAGDGGRGNEAIECRSLDCPVYYERRKTDKESAAAAAHAEAFERSLSW